jgi:transposase
MNTYDLCLLLLNLGHFELTEIKIQDHQIILGLESTVPLATCPACGTASKSLHSRYTRYPIDLPWADYAVLLELQAKRFFCQNEACRKRTFAERFPEVVVPYARKTNRVLHKQRYLGVNVCASVGEKLLALEGIGASDTTLNRLLCCLPEPEKQAVQVLGVDDWAKRKGQRYGTILVDLESSQIIDLLGDRTAETLIQWLKNHPEVQTVSRDRSPTYADAVQKALPEATQVADRWHLLKNASDALYTILQQESSVIRTYLEPNTDAKAGQEPLSQPKEAEQPPTTAEQQREKRMQQAKELRDLGWSQKRIAQQLDVHPKTIRRYLRSSSAKARRSRTRHLTDPFQPYLLKRWNEGCHNAAQLFREIQAQGYAGHTTMVLSVIRGFRKASGLPARIRTAKAEPLLTDPTHRPPTLRTLTFAVMGRPEKCTEEHKRLLERICAEQLPLSELISLARTFAALVREQQAEKLQDWLTRSQSSSYRIWKNFALGIEQDRQAVQAALTYPWSNGPTEGHINRLKCLKRLMYGRAKDDLLRKRVLWQGKWGFT